MDDDIHVKTNIKVLSEREKEFKKISSEMDRYNIKMWNASVRETKRTANRNDCVAK
jgi:hypothetical protein